MPAKIAIATVAEILQRHQLSPALLRQIVEEMTDLTLRSESDEAPPAVKKQFVFILADSTGLIAQRVDLRNLVGWVVQIPETASPFTTLERVLRGAYDFNASKRGRLLPVKSIGAALENVPARYFSEADLTVRTKLPVALVVTDDRIPLPTKD